MKIQAGAKSRRDDKNTGRWWSVAEPLLRMYEQIASPDWGDRISVVPSLFCWYLLFTGVSLRFTPAYVLNAPIGALWGKLIYYYPIRHQKVHHSKV